VVQQPVRLIDVFPTVLDLLGLPVPTDLPARSLEPLLLGDEEESARPLFSERLSGSWERRLVEGDLGAMRWREMSSLQLGRRKLIEMQDPERAGEWFYLTFDLERNPQERLEVQAPAMGALLDRSDPAFVADPQLLALLKELQAAARGRALEPSPEHLPPEEEEALRALGYAR
jgi:arylsulfatase A-like enzyme